MKMRKTMVKMALVVLSFVKYAFRATESQLLTLNEIVRLLDSFHLLVPSMKAELLPLPELL